MAKSTPHQPVLPFDTPPYPTRRPTPATLGELELRAQALAGSTVQDLAGLLGIALPQQPGRHKGFVGQLVEYALGADPKAGDQPDFPELGVELKTVPMGRHGKPAESTFCCAISMGRADRITWDQSRLRRKLQHVLWVPVDSAKLATLGARRFHAARLWTPSAAVLQVLREDWEDLMGAIGTGEAASARLGRYIQVRPKGARATDRTVAPSAHGTDTALPLGFYLRASFTAKLLRGEL